MAKTRSQAIRQKAIFELERLSLSLDEELEITANMPVAGIDADLCEMGVDPSQLPPLNLCQMLSKNESKTLAYAYVSDELLRDEPITGEVKLLILKLRHLSRQQRYQEALELAKRATLLAPNYWRALISYGGLLVLLGHIDMGEAIFRGMVEEFSGNPKAAAAALHGCACVKEITCKLSLSDRDLMEVSRLYEEALKFDESRANTRACLVINSFLSGQTKKSMALFADSLQCEGFFDAMSFELEERRSRENGVKMYNVMQAFPMWFRNLLYGLGPGDGGLNETSVAY